MKIVKYEAYLANSLAGAFIVALISGVLLYINWAITHGAYIEIALIVHLIVSIYFFTFSVIYIFIHIKRTMKNRRSSAFFSGITAFITCGFSLYSGLILLLPSRYNLDSSENSTYIHLATSLLFFIFIVGHIAFSRFNNKRQAKVLTPHLNRSSYISSIFWFLISITVSLALVFTLYNPISSTETTVITANYVYPYGENPFEPSKTTTDGNKFIPRQFIGQSEKCSSCHTDIFNQWGRSAHRYAAADPAYVKNINLLEKKKGIESTRYCEGCHAPIALLSGQLTESRSHGGTPGTMAFNEGISCLSCHRMVSINNTEGVASYHFRAVENSPIINSRNHMSKKFADFLITASPKKHKALFNNTVTSQAKSCASCHAQFMDKEMNDWGWIKMQDEYTAWLESPYSGHGDEKFSNENVTTCQDCHMPLITSTDPAAGKDGMIRSHNFAAANTVIPSFFGDKKQLNDVINHLKSNKIRVTIEPPKDNILLNHAATISAKNLGHNDAPMHFYAGTSSEVNIAVSNVGVGHAFPGGSTDIQEAWLHFQAVDSTGDIVFESGTQSASSGSAAIYKTIPVDRHGKHVWKHDLFNAVGDALKNVIPSGKSDIVNIELNIPKNTKGPITLHASIRYRKFTPEYEKWVFEDKQIDIPVVEVARTTIVVPIKIEAPAS